MSGRRVLVTGATSGDEAGEVTGCEDIFTKIGMCRRHDAQNGLGEGDGDPFVR